MTENEGSGQPQDYCPTCGDPVRPGNNFCTSCGKQVSTESQAPDRVRTPSTLDNFTTGNRGQGSKRVDFDRLKQNVHRLYEEASLRYRNWREARAAEQERTEALRSFEHERGARRSRFRRYLDFFERASSGSRNLSDWWQAYQDEESDSEQTTTSHLLLSALSRAEAGLNRLREMDGTFSDVLERGEFEKADFLLDGMRAGQENVEGEESVFVPLAAAHDRVKRLDGWAQYRAELEKLIKGLEDLLASPAVRTPAANRLRFPDPGGPQLPEAGTRRSFAHVSAPGEARRVGNSSPGSPSQAGRVRKGLDTRSTVGIVISTIFVLGLLWLIALGLSAGSVGETDELMLTTLEAVVGESKIDDVKVSGSKATVIVAGPTSDKEARSICHATLSAASGMEKVGRNKAIREASVKTWWSPWSKASC